MRLNRKAGIWKHVRLADGKLGSDGSVAHYRLLARTYRVSVSKSMSCSKGTTSIVTLSSASPRATRPQSNTL
jgi:hypothetical protein